MLVRKSLVSQVAHVYSEDPALDRMDAGTFADRWDKFLKTADISLLPVRDGARPTVFQLRRLSRRQQEYVANLDGARMVAAAVAYGLAGVSEFEVDGRPLLLEFDPSDIGPRVRDKNLEDLYDIGLFTELALRILQVSRLGFQLG